ncbi:MAG: preprotein translocase subunit YajC [Oscillospiraceae bacterium]|jgi:preprotein translocase subunit YajC|nr:preprotein translocase subunit YajC [Oscillospiraceae bacterium]
MDPQQLLSLAPLLILVVVFYFFILRPENKKKKAIAEMRSNISVGSEITTQGGIVGKVVSIKDDLITIETGDDRVRVQLTRWAVGSVGIQENQ